MIDMKELKPGDRVRIVDRWDQNTGENPSGYMNHWLGTVMIVREIDHWGRALMEEDRNEHKGEGWVWNKYCIAEIIPDVEIDLDDLV